MNAGRLPKPLADLQDRTMDNVAYALDEQRNTQATFTALKDLFVEVMVTLDAPMCEGRVRIAQGFAKVYRLLTEQYDLDCVDAENGTAMGADVTVLIKQREPLHTQTALTRRVRV